MRLKVGEQAPTFSIKDVEGKTISLEAYKNKKTLLCFFRYAGCPFCTLVFTRLLKQYGEFASQGLSVIAFFQSPEKTVRQYIERFDAPFSIIADQDKVVYTKYQIESSLLGWPNTLVQTPQVLGDMVKNKIFQGKIDGDPNLIPAYFLIGPPEFAIYQAHYGSSFLNEISVSDIEEFLQKS